MPSRQAAPYRPAARLLMRRIGSSLRSSVRRSDAFGFRSGGGPIPDPAVRLAGPLLRADRKRWHRPFTRHCNALGAIRVSRGSPGPPPRVARTALPRVRVSDTLPGELSPSRCSLPRFSRRVGLPQPLVPIDHPGPLARNKLRASMRTVARIGTASRLGRTPSFTRACSGMTTLRPSLSCLASHRSPAWSRSTLPPRPRTSSSTFFRPTWRRTAMGTAAPIGSTRPIRSRDCQDRSDPLTTNLTVRSLTEPTAAESALTQVPPPSGPHWCASDCNSQAMSSLPLWNHRQGPRPGRSREAWEYSDDDKVNYLQTGIKEIEFMRPE